MPTKSLNIGVIGSTGFVGSYTCLELVSRGHTVTGFARSPDKLGFHKLHKPYPLDFEAANISALSEAFRNLDVVVCAYGPHATGLEGLLPMPFIEVVRKVVLAVRNAKVGYMVMVGGCGSLYVPGQGLETCLDSEEWWIAYRRGMSDSDGHVAYMQKRFGPGIVEKLMAYRHAREAVAADKETAKSRRVIDSMEKNILATDPSVGFISACRACFMFFDKNTSFRWSFVSPAALLRAGKRTGAYETVIDVVALKGDQSHGMNMSGRLHGISAGDLAIAIADDCEKQTHVWKHWSPYGDVSDQTPVEIAVTLDILTS